VPALVYALGEGARKLPTQKIRDGMLAAAAIGYLCKHHATLSAAEGGAVKAWTAFAIASNEIASRHRVNFDETVIALAQTAKDMNSKYKETSEAGLAQSVTLC
jgi:L-serine deaminase